MKQNNNRSLIFLLIFAVLTVVLFNMPFGRYILYPFIILGTWFHEMSHGLMAIAMGGNFHKLELFADGSGFAVHSGGLLLGPIGNAMVAAAGPLGPTIAGSLLLIASKHIKVSKFSLYFLGFFQIISSLIWIRSLFGVIIISLFGILTLFVAYKGSERMQKLTIQFLAIQAFTSLYLSIDYLFSRGGVVAGSSFSSDTGVMAQNLLLPHWFWAVAILLLSLLMIYASLKSVLKKDYVK
jgi:hypothetical protein